MTFEPRCKACRENDKTLFYVYCAGCILRKDYANRIAPKPMEHPAISRESFPSTFPPSEKS